MRNIILRMLYAVAVFIAAAFLLELFAFHNDTSESVVLNEASLPIVTMEVSGVSFNELHGYTDPRDIALMHTVITPLGADRSGGFSVYGGDADITKVSIEVRNINGSRLIENKDLELQTDTDGLMHATFALQDLIDPGSEYMLVVLVSTPEHSDVRYYTRILYEDDAEDTLYQGAGYQAALAFLKRFHDGTVSGEDEAFVSALIEPEAARGGSSLASVGIHSSYSDVTYDELDPEEIVAPVISIREINGASYIAECSFVVASHDVDGSVHYYDCNENFRIRMGMSRFHLINYQRTMEQVFEPTSETYSAGTIHMGIVDEQMQIKASESGGTVAFVNGGRLFSCRTEDNTVTQVFGFSTADGTDRREIYPGHDIRILRVTDKGDVDFIVYGYMNRGLHEGEVGAAAYHYSSEYRMITENAFVRYGGPSEVIRAQVGRSNYLSGRGTLFLLLDGLLYEVDLGKKSADIIRPDMQDGQTLMSESGRIVTWREAKDDVATGNLVLLDLADMSRHVIEANEEEELIPLGFMGEDLIYGTAREADRTSDAAGMEFTPMYRIDIVDHSLEHLEEYEQDGYYISEAVIVENQITLHRVISTASGYVAASDDQIVSAKKTQTRSALLSAATSESAGRVYNLAVTGFVPEQRRYAEPRELSADETQEIRLSVEDDGTGRLYFDVYGIYGYEARYVDVADAVRRASAGAGVVIDSSGRTAWKRTGVERCELDDFGLEPIAENAQGTEQDLAERMRQAFPSYDILELSGCSMEDVLYYPSIGSPVLALTGGDNAVLIIGYGPQNIAVYDPRTGERRLVPRQSAKAMFENGGNRYLTYMKEVE